MKLASPKALLSKYVITPVYKFYKNYIGLEARHNKLYKPVANFIYENGKDIPVVMLAFNAISIISSHINQWIGLNKSKRENKDYLKKQEMVDLGLDISLSIIPPFILNNYLTKKLDSGLWTTKSGRDNLMYLVAPAAGVEIKDLYNTDHIVPVREQFTRAKNSLLKTLKKKKVISDNLFSKLNIIEKDPNLKIPIAGTEELVTDADVVAKGKKAFEKFRNKSAYSEIWDQRNGYLVMAAIAYTVVVGNVVLPILKNKISNYLYNKELEKKGETKEGLKRKKRFNSLAQTTQIDDNQNIFEAFSNSDNSVTKEKIPDRILYKNLLEVDTGQKKTFSDVQFMGRITSQSDRLRI